PARHRARGGARSRGPCPGRALAALAALAAEADEPDRLRLARRPALGAARLEIEAASSGRGAVEDQALIHAIEREVRGDPDGSARRVLDGDLDAFELRLRTEVRSRIGVVAGQDGAGTVGRCGRATAQRINQDDQPSAVLEEHLEAN